LPLLAKYIPLLYSRFIGMLWVMKRQKKAIPNFLRKFRSLMGFSQTEIARRLNHKSTNRISRWEQGLSMPNPENLFKLALLYKTMPTELYSDLNRKFMAELFPEEAGRLLAGTKYARKKPDKSRPKDNSP
jgi:transcriptional regulator with XRE-family HTH domain